MLTRRPVPRVSRGPRLLAHGQRVVGESGDRAPEHARDVTIVKVRGDVRNYDEDPGWYQHPPGTVALTASDRELARDGIDVNEPIGAAR